MSFARPCSGKCMNRYELVQPYIAHESTLEVKLHGWLYVPVEKLCPQLQNGVAFFSPANRGFQVLLEAVHWRSDIVVDQA